VKLFVFLFLQTGDNLLNVLKLVRFGNIFKVCIQIFLLRIFLIVDNIYLQGFCFFLASQTYAMSCLEVRLLNVDNILEFYSYCVWVDGPSNYANNNFKIFFLP
jgi:hypothetical protein